MNVRTTAPTAPNPEAVREERVLYERSLFGVLAGILGNCAAGLGAGFVAGVVAHALGVSGATLARAVIYSWLVVWGVLMVAWFGSDEFTVVRLRHQRDVLAGDLDAAEDEIDALHADLATVRHENGIMAWRLVEAGRNRNYTPAVAPESPAYRDAREMIRAWAKTGDHPSRRKMGWTDSRHSAAMNVLQGRSIVTVGKGNTVTWHAPDAPTALLLLASNKSLPLDWPGGDASASQGTEGEEDISQT